MASNCSNSQIGSAIANSGSSTSCEAFAIVCSASFAHAAASACGRCGNSQTVTRMDPLPGRYQTFTRAAGSTYSRWPGTTSKASYHASRLRTVFIRQVSGA